jgi:hypothetical protein
MDLEVFQHLNGQLHSLGILSPGCLLGGLVEQGSYSIKVPTTGTGLFIDDAPIAMDAQGQYWCWSPGFFAGEVLVELALVDHFQPLRYRLDVSAASHKSGREQYLEYIREIADIAPQLLLGTEPGQHGLGGSSDLTKLAHWLSYARLRWFIDAYLSGLRAVCERPLVRNRHRREQMPIHLARQVDVRTVRRLEANPNLLAAVARQLDAAEQILDDNRLDVPFNEPTMDHPANRLLASQLQGVVRLVRQLRETFSATSHGAGDTETDIQSRINRRLDYLGTVEKSLLRLSRRDPFAAVTRSEAGVAALNAVSSSPHYARTHRLGLRLLRKGIASLATDEQHYLAPTWQVYEAWCFVTLGEKFQKQLPEYAWCRKDAVSWADMLLEGVKGEERIRLYFQLGCPALEAENSHGYASISRERRPDLVLEYVNDELIQYICLDSKYSASKDRLLDSMASAHIYRDSIRREGVAPRLSLLLVPQNKYAPRLSGIEYISRHSVGCLAMASSQQAELVVKWLWQELQGS